jgi:hypothetical protein
MFHRIPRCRRLAVILVCIFAFRQSPVMSETNKVAKDIVCLTNAPSTNGLIWVTDENHFRGKMATNGFVCDLWLRDDPFYQGQQSPVFAVSLINKTPNKYMLWNGDPTTFLHIDLLDSTGRMVKRTAQGMPFGLLMNQKELEDKIKKRFGDWASGRFRTEGFTFSSPDHSYPLATFSLQELFTITKPGEYTLKVKMRSVQRMDANRLDANLIFTSIPEVIAPIQIRSAEISK